MRPEAEQRLRAGFQRRVDKQRERHAPDLAHAAQLAAGSGCGQLAGVFSRQAPFRAPAVVTGLLPLAAVPFLVIGRQPVLDPAARPRRRGTQDGPGRVPAADRGRAHP